ncbi:MAG: hypothetical protein KDI32_04845 [Pseudomonadales bacterium]|nr:hypothetical protein [Pseudomonadales bacterium]
MPANVVKTFACAAIAVVLAIAVSWTFIDSTSLVRWNGTSTHVATVVASALVR